ncbi:CBS domain-containing protein [Mesorhizobium sp. STM 4661]|uniref:CBS domain-containing protein n=1 Tax=Mesorhizobium sp. STM 4661 TaxID=1297570 RepID=UPI0002BDFE32|nr:CBS domain-containing protein [Mesorhizobium sp. STM 4661]CCV09962.1 putative transcriptional regulator, XRE family [Mesorhizobium sp. STM 4661]
MTYNLLHPLEAYGSSEEILQEVSEGLQAGSEPPRLTVREFLKWFDAQRRGPNIVAWIDDLLSEAKLETKPNYVNTYIDDDISIVALSPPDKASAEKSAEAVSLSDPVLRIGSLKSGKAAPLVVTPNDSLRHAITLMMVNDFSQLPVVTGPRDIKGIISWKTIGERLASKVKGEEVRHFIEPANIVPHDASFFKSIPGIIEHEHVLVRGEDNSLASILTTTDLSDQFLQLTEPFLLINEIENHVRLLLQNWADLSKPNLANVCKLDDSYTNIFDLSFGDYVRIFQSDLISDPFPLNIDRKEFCTTIDQIRGIRNDVMHFSADPTPPESIFKLRKVSEYLRKLQVLTS